jgi:hypothetical protein
MLDAHEQMFGEAGRQCAEIVLRWARSLFAVPLDTLNIRVVLAPVELGPYNRHLGYCAGGEGEAAFILGNRHIVRLEAGTLVLVQNLEQCTDFIIHELTHHRQLQLEAAHADDPNWERKRAGTHRNRGWYQAIAEACPNYLGVEFPSSSWPTGPRPKKGTHPLSEVEAGHWPASFRGLIRAGDPRLPLPNSSNIAAARIARRRGTGSAAAPARTRTSAAPRYMLHTRPAPRKERHHNS